MKVISADGHEGTDASLIECLASDASKRNIRGSEHFLHTLEQVYPIKIEKIRMERPLLAVFSTSNYRCDLG
jgi:hypothetical protein